MLRHRCSKPRRSCGVYAVVHVNAQRRAHDEIRRIANAHKIAGLVWGKPAAAKFHNAPKRIFALASSEASDRVAWNISVALQKVI